jgi:hypothetical protein
MEKMAYTAMEEAKLRAPMTTEMATTSHTA